MLNDSERRRLNEIEQGLWAQDPSFARRISTAAPPRPSGRLAGLGPLGWLFVAVGGTGLALLYRSGWLALIALSAICLSMGLWSAQETPHR